MLKNVIYVENLKKKFCKNLRHGIIHAAADITRGILGIKPKLKLRKSEFYALNNVSMVLKKGESLGLIGSNGSGKTTLLRILAGILKYDYGKISVDGRLTPLIATGAGFHPHLSGRENIYLNASILGMSKKEIDKRLQKIIDFSEINEFIDSPVAAYSSGMLARLGFAIAINTPSDIVLVDEVLAVGDMNFQAKCFRAINDFKEKGGSIILVSHSMYNIRNFCDRAVWLEKGKIKDHGDVNEVTQEFEIYSSSNDYSSDGRTYVQDGLVVRKAVCDKQISAFEDLRILLNIDGDIPDPIIGVYIFSDDGRNIASIDSGMNGKSFDLSGMSDIKITIKNLPLADGSYFVNLVVYSGNRLNYVVAYDRMLRFRVRNSTSNISDGELIRTKVEWNIVSV